MYAKRVEHEAKIDAKIVDFLHLLKKGEHARNYMFNNIKRGSGMQKSHAGKSNAKKK